MTILDLDSLPEHRLIVEYILEYRGAGHFLAYDEYQLVVDWLSIAGSVDRLLIVLSELVPKYYVEDAPRRHPRSLKGLALRVERRLKQLKVRDVDIG